MIEPEYPRYSYRELQLAGVPHAEAQEAEHAERGERQGHHPGEDGPLDTGTGENLQYL